PPPFIDPNGDNNMFPDDVLMLVNAFNSGQTEIQGEQIQGEQIQGEQIYNYIDPTSFADASNDGEQNLDDVVVSNYESDGLFDQNLKRNRIVDTVFNEIDQQESETNDLLGDFDLDSIL
ncbi:MAG: hypothetical protein ACI9HK_004134, partial [Pirellulaceae bacterium]